MTKEGFLSIIFNNVNKEISYSNCRMNIDFIHLNIASARYYKNLGNNKLYKNCINRAIEYFFEFRFFT